MDLRSRQLEKTVGLTVPQLIVLKELLDHDGSTAGFIAKKANLSQATVTPILDRLEQRGAIVRQRATEDRRKVHINLTPVGKDLVEKSPAILQEDFLEAFDTLQNWEQTQILATVQRIAAMMKAEKLPARPVLTVDPLPIDGEMGGNE